MKTAQEVGADTRDGAAGTLLVTNAQRAAGTHQAALHKDWKLPLSCCTG